MYFWLISLRPKIQSESKSFKTYVGIKKKKARFQSCPLTVLSRASRRNLSSVHSLSRDQLFATPWTAARQASLSMTSSQSLLKLMSIESVMPSNHLILCHPLLFLPSIFPSIRVFSNDSVLRIRCPNYWSFSFTISPSNGHSGLISFRMTGSISLLSKDPQESSSTP